MSQQTDERAFEALVEETLLQESGWEAAPNDEWDVERALFPARVCSFLESTQPKLWAKVRTLLAEDLEQQIVAALVKELTIKGTLHVLRHGFKFYGNLFRLATFRPAHGLNDEILSLYRLNRLTVSRQVLCHPAKQHTVDLLFALNGIPVATCELKNPSTGQNWQDAVSQYKTDRDQNAPVFRFKARTLVHFAADPHEIHMTTRLSGNKTRFLPFNRGSHPGEVQCGSGNPQDPSGHRTAYFWRDILQRDSFLDILGHFLFVEKSEKKVNDGKNGQRLVTRESMIFPRYHQLDAVSKILADARKDGPGRNFLIQHSAGSGKTNSISWLSHRLASLHDSDDRKVFDCVVVISDRRVLDRQLQDAIYQIEHAQGVVKAIDHDSKQLAEALIDGTRIVITTLQKFPFVLGGLLRVAGAESRETASPETKAQARTWQQEIAKRTYAVIVDEAHSSQTGETARALKELLGSAGSKGAEGSADWEDRLVEVMASRGQQPNLSFFAFTATPKGKTLELFGTPSQSGKPEAFHLYSMRQAIEEGFILDVLANYTSYSVFYQLLKATEEDPALLKKKGIQALAKFMSLHPHNIEQKTEVIIEHFRRSVRHRLNGRAKAMVVTTSRLLAVRYKISFERYIREKGYGDIRALVAFSGTVRDPETGMEYTEPGMNPDVVTGRPISESMLPDRFDSPDYHLLLVAEKYQTGFDQPLLCAMYVDKRLDGVQAVQTLSRLNRMVPGKDVPFVLDFMNDAEDIRRAFKPYYDRTELAEESDPAKLEALSHELDEAQVYHQSEVDAFAKVFYKPTAQQTSSDHGHILRHLQPAVDRFVAIKDKEQQQAFRTKLSGYVRVYAFQSQITPYTDRDLEILYSFGRLLLPHLPHGRSAEVIAISEDVELEYYRKERIWSGPINVAEGEEELVKGPTDVGTGRGSDDKAPLSELISLLNEKFGTDFGEEHRLFFQQIKETATKKTRIVQMAIANPLDKFEIGVRTEIQDTMIECMAENDQLVTKYMEEDDFRAVADSELAKSIFDSVHSTPTPTAQDST